MERVTGSSQSGRSAEPKSLIFHTKADVAYRELRRQIISGELPPDQHLNQEHVAVMLGVSTTPLREALRKLESEHLIVTTVHRDVMVAPLDLEQMTALYETKEVLECFATGAAARRATPADHRRMLEALERLDSRETVAEDPAWSANRAVHEAIYTASHNAMVIDFLNTAWDHYERFRRVMKVVFRDPSIERDHVGIVEAVIAGDATAAEDAMRNHLRRARDYIDAELVRSGEAATVPARPTEAFGVASRQSPSEKDASRSQPRAVPPVI